jgi:hypothetical protein
MANEPIYDCTNCGANSSREQLTVKKVYFQEMGAGGRSIKSRVVGWLCPLCVKKDPDFNREPFRAPNNRRASSLERLSG